MQLVQRHEGEVAAGHLGVECGGGQQPDTKPEDGVFI